MSALLSLRRPALCDRPASLGSFKWGTRWIHMGDPGKHTGILQPQKKSWKMGVDQVDDHDWGYELTKIIPAMLFQDVLYWKASRPWTLGCSKAPQFILSTVHEFSMVFSSWTPFASAEILANFEQFLISSGWWLRLRRKGGRGIFNGTLRRIVGSSMGTDLDGSTDSYWWKWPLSDFLYHSYSFFIGYHWIPSSSTEVPFVEAISCDLLWANEVHHGTPHLAHGPVPKHYFSSSYINGGIRRVPSWNLGVYHFWKRRLSNDSTSTAGGYLPTRGGLLP